MLYCFNSTTPALKQHYSGFNNHPLVVTFVPGVVAAVAVASRKEYAEAVVQAVLQIDTGLQRIEACRYLIVFILERFNVLVAKVSADE